MRKIIMSKPGEFLGQEKVDVTRGAAMKMLAEVMLKDKPVANESSEVRVSVSDDPGYFWKLFDK